RRTRCRSGRTNTWTNTRAMVRSIRPPGSPTRRPSMVSCPRAGSTEQPATRTSAAVVSSMVATAYAHRLFATKSVRKNAMAPPATRSAARVAATRTRLSTASFRTRLSVQCAEPAAAIASGSLQLPTGGRRPWSRRLREARQVSIDLSEVERLRFLVHRRWRPQRCRPFGRTFRAAGKSELRRHACNHRLVDHRDPRHVPFEQRIVAQGVDDARGTAREAVHGVHRLGGERHARRTGEPQAMLDVGLSALRRQMRQAELDGYALRERRGEAPV